jgi:hypothetical protein
VENDWFFGNQWDCDFNTTGCQTINAVRGIPGKVNELTRLI